MLQFLQPSLWGGYVLCVPVSRLVLSETSLPTQALSAMYGFRENNSPEDMDQENNVVNNYTIRNNTTVIEPSNNKTVNISLLNNFNLSNGTWFSYK